MLDNIKSSFFIKIVFSYFDNKRKLEIIKYNKNLQNKLDINIKYYKIFSGRYIIYESSKKGKEYSGYTNKLLYEGEFLNGKRNGKGKAYPDDELIFDVEYTNGQLNGKCKIYKDNKLFFEGEYLDNDIKNGICYDENGKAIYAINENEMRKELKNLFFFPLKGSIRFYLNGSRNGKGEEYDYDHNLIFKGEYLNGKRNGKGKEYYKNGMLRFEGEYINDQRNGKGICYFPFGESFYEGEYIYGIPWNIKEYDEYGNSSFQLKNGKGLVKRYEILKDELFYVEEEYLNGEQNGKVKSFKGNKNGILIFEGEFINGQTNGKGKEYNLDGKLKFEGEYIYKKKIKGKFYYKGRLEYEGDFLYDRKFNGIGYDENGNKIYELINGNGKVNEYYPDETSFKGEYLNGKRNGKGKIYSKGILLFEAEFLNDKMIYAKEYNLDGNLIYEGEYLNEKKSGKGKQYDYNGKLIYEGEYLEGKRNGKGKLFNKKGLILFEGEFNDMGWSGKKKLYSNDNELIYEQEYLNGEKISKNYPERIIELINNIRKDPVSYAKIIENSIKNIVEDKNKDDPSKSQLIYKQIVKVLLHKGKEAFLEAADILRNSEPLPPLKFLPEICVPLPDKIEDLKDRSYLKTQVEKLKGEGISIDVYFKDLIKVPEVSALLMVVDDSEIKEGRKRNALLNKDFKYIGVNSKFIGNTFAAYFSFSK